ncbi:hypothetical protein BHYA_0219g00070 [Botrytis hyacinthi]|uniref:Uncharacterized protein n=1 Tax=Botrytis hyacinthi TaxID=278943 RepID=A0A4Z1GEX5_9HELO|nr:hypothetical protein BHYA_0219g00070 [Botrytis hyacinthi]
MANFYRHGHLPTKTRWQLTLVKNKYAKAFDALAGASPEDFYQLNRDASLDFSGNPIEQIQKRDGNVIGFNACSTTSTSIALPTDLLKFSKTSVSAASTSTPRFSKPASMPPQPPAYNGRCRPDYQLPCMGKNMGGIRSVDRRIALDAISVICVPVKTKMKIKSKPSQYIHMSNEFSDDQNGYHSLHPDPNLPNSSIPYNKEVALESSQSENKVKQWLHKPATSFIPIKRLSRALIEIYQKQLQEMSACDDELILIAVNHHAHIYSG